MRKLALVLIMFLLSVFVAVQVQSGMTQTKHNLSITGPGTIKATTETQICVFCHTPHAALQVEGATWRGPLWNHSLSVASYTLSIPGQPSAASNAQLSTPIQPDRASKLCLSCHDGTVAIGNVYNVSGPGLGSGSIAMTTTYMPEGSTKIGGASGNLIPNHLVSIAYNNNLINDKNIQCGDGVSSFEWRLPANLTSGSKIKLKDTNATYATFDGYNYNAPGKCSKCGVQCSTCHDPHGTPCTSGPGCDTVANVYKKFFVVDYIADNANLCAFCHRVSSEGNPDACENNW